MTEVRATEARVTAPGGLSVRVAGMGAPVLFLHGIGGAATSFASQQDQLADYLTIAWDAPGYGASADLELGSGIARSDPAGTYADAALGVLACLGQRDAHVVGVSWGGVIATRMALRRPSAVRSLTLADSSRGSGRTEAGRIGMMRRMEELATLGSRAFAELRGPNLLAPDAPTEQVDRVVTTMSQVRLSGYTGAAHMMASTDHSAELGRIAVPTLVLVGEHDRVTGIAESQALAAGIPHALFEVVPGGGHAVNQENPTAFNACLRRFLASIKARSAHFG